MTVHEDDDTARNIMQAQQADAMPDEADRKRNVKCDGCGQRKESARHRGHLTYVASCPGVQSPPARVYCDACWSESQSKEDAVRDYFEHGGADFVVEYGCGVLRAVDVQEELEEAGWDSHQPHRGWSPKIRLQHDRCGSVIETVWSEDDLEDTEENQ